VEFRALRSSERIAGTLPRSSSRRVDQDCRCGLENRLALNQLLDKQSSVITRRQALDSGVHPNVLHRRARAGGPWQRILPGVYLTLTGTPTTDQLETAAVLYGGPSATLTGPAALRRHGMRVQSDRVDVLVPAKRRVPSTAFVVVHRTTRLPENVLHTSGSVRAGGAGSRRRRPWPA
jgi:hypothetical protein